MSESEVPFLLFLVCEFFVGAIVGASISKDRESFPRGMIIALLLAFAVLLYLAVFGTLAAKSFDSPVEALLGVLGVIIFLLTAGFAIWLICLLVAAAGYWSAFVIFRRLRIGPNRITLASVFAFMTILAAVAALIQMVRRPPQ